MKRNVFLKRALIAALVVMMVPFGALSQQTATSGNTFSQAELDQMLAPIALYPDSLLAQVLIAATYPGDVTEADRWVKANASLKGDALNQALEQVQWDESVKALAPFPEVLDMLAKQSDWTARLGEAFMTQQADVTASIQRLRQKAYAAGNLQTNPQEKVVVQGENIEIEPANPQVVYVPSYDPTVIYGPWWWPAYPPFAYFPVWPGVAIASFGLFGFWGGIGIGPAWWGWGWGAWNWGGGGVVVNVGFNSHGGHGYSGGRSGGYHAGGGKGSGSKSSAAKSGGSKSSAAKSGGSKSSASRSSARSAGSRTGGSRSAARSSGGARRTGGGGGGRRTGGGGGRKR